ncbi:hypothetical protein [Tenacibaculum ascidiaceicola]|uniref:hypothetical protein n=1 Tax=Tenacibaculum TaxID=104267 RepID=UPI0038959297
MIIIYKNRGILIPLFLILPFVGTTILSGVLKRNIGGIFAYDYDFQIVMGIGLLISSLWTYLKSGDYIMINGIKEKIEMNNHFFYIPMKTWSYIMFAGGILVLAGGLLETFLN